MESNEIETLNVFPSPLKNSIFKFHFFHPGTDNCLFDFFGLARFLTRNCLTGKTLWICLSKLRTAGCDGLVMPKEYPVTGYQSCLERNLNWKEETRPAKKHLAENSNKRAAGFGQGWVAKLIAALCPSRDEEDEWVHLSTAKRGWPFHASSAHFRLMFG